jgi:hypothetical protein
MKTKLIQILIQQANHKKLNNGDKVMIKHVGKHDQRKCVLLFKEVPGEDDMCLIVYTDLLPKLVHDPVMRCVESEVGQNSNDITGPLQRTLMDDGRNVLNTIHANGYIRKVPTNQMILTPNSSTTIRLDELNKIMKDMASGEDATKRLADLDANAGMKDPAKALPESVPLVADGGVLTDASIAQGQLSQADRMAEDAQRLLNESASLREEAYVIAPELRPKKRGRPPGKTKDAATTVKG